MSDERLSFCERVTATPTSPWHIRVVGPEGLKLGGGAPDTTLCGASLSKGWDLNGGGVSPERVRQLGPYVCSRCALAYLKPPASSGVSR